MKVAVLIPDRGDRPKFLANCLRMVNGQTLKPDHIELVNDPPPSEKKDITWRYRTGYERLRGKGFDVIALMENDDYYHPTYLETMVRQWEEHGRPEIFGCNYTVYYHIRLFAWFTMHHVTRSSAMNTLIRPGLDFPWTVDHDPYTDIWLWKVLNGKIWEPPMICIGIKHGEGLSGGRNHTDRLGRFVNDDSDHEFLKEHMDDEGYGFYSAYFAESRADTL